MEIILNIAWVLFSLALIGTWTRNTGSNSVPRRTQIVALAMVVLLLLPVISVSDDLLAMQGPSESDASLRKVLHSDETHPSAAPTSFALPEQMATVLASNGSSMEILEDRSPQAPASSLTRSLDSRPPPQG